MAKPDLNAEVTKLRAVLEKNSRLRLEFLGQFSSLLRTHHVDISDALLSQLTVALKTGADGEDTKSPKQNVPPHGVEAASPKQNVAASLKSPSQNVPPHAMTAASPKQNVASDVKSPSQNVPPHTVTANSPKQNVAAAKAAKPAASKKAPTGKKK